MSAKEDQEDPAPNYSEAMEELQRIVQEIEDADISVDELSRKVERASVLIRFCRSKLHKTEKEVESVLAQMKEEKEGNEEGKDTEE